MLSLSAIRNSSVDSVYTIDLIKQLAPSESVEEANPPTIALIGSNPIILHQNSETVYIEQGAMAFDDVDGDLSNKVVIASDLDRNTPGVYKVTYRVTNGEGITTTAERSVWVLASNTKVDPGQAFTFDEKGKKGDKPVSHEVSTDANGIMGLDVSGLNKFGVKVTVTDGAGNTVYTENFSANANREIQVDPGDYKVTSEITDGNGNNKYSLKLAMPSKSSTYFDMEEVPL